MSTVSVESFIGRAEILDAVTDHAKSDAGVRPFLLSAKPGAGSSELLRQAYDRLFFDDGEVIPFYFEFRPTDLTVRQAVIRFLQAFLVQLTAFRREDAALTSVTPDVCELSDLALPSDSYWVGKLIETCRRESELNDEASFVRHALSAPLRAAAENTVVFPMIGGLEHTKFLEGETDVFEQIKETFALFGHPFLFAGARRFLLNGVKKGITRIDEFKSFELDSLNLKESSELCKVLSKSLGVESTPQTCDLAGLQMDGSPLFISALFHAAAEKKENLDSFKAVQQTYVSELFGGRLRGYFDSCFEALSENSDVQKNLIDLIYGSREFSKNAAPAESWSKNLGLAPEGFRRAINTMNAREFINNTSNLIVGNGGSLVFDDYVSMRFRLEVERGTRPSVYGDLLTHALKRAPEMMAGFYRRSTSIGLRELLTVFDCQEIPASLFHYGQFKQDHKGKTDDEIAADTATETESISLPQIVYTVNAVSIYEQIGKFTDKERSAIAIGFESADYTDESETVWIAAEVEFKLEAEAELTEFWCDRLEMVALMSDYRNYRLWLISPEGFSPEAVAVLNARNAIGSSRKQVELLVRHLKAEDIVGSVKPDKAFEIVVPMGEDTELIAAHAVEEIARRHSFGTKAINQIKTALVEACINATEHSKSPDRKIYQRFEVKDDKIVITISNRGLRFKGKETKEITPTDGRRGWGLKLMKTLMDDVRFEQVDDGTRISMTKLRK